MNILIAGQNGLAPVFRAARDLPGVSIAAVCALRAATKLAAQANLRRSVIASGGLNAASIPPGIDLIVAAHSRLHRPGN